MATLGSVLPWCMEVPLNLSELCHSRVDPRAKRTPAVALLANLSAQSRFW